MTEFDSVGPVLESDEVGLAIVAAIRAANRDVTVLDRGGYLRVLVPGRCIVERAAVERVLGRAFRLPRDLELVMPSFKGRIRFTEEQVEWSWRTT